MTPRELLSVFAPNRVTVVYLTAVTLILLVAFLTSTAHAQVSEITAALTTSASEVDGMKAPIAAILGSLVVISFAVWVGSGLAKR